jgi:hypothetical protein
VFNLDRGADEPFAVSVNFARDGGGEVLRAYNDLLVVGSNFGDARLVGTNLGAWDEDEFVGLDFSIVDGLAISVDSEHVPALLAALNRMAGDQGFGQLIVPADLIGSVASADSALQRSGRSARDYLPQDERRDPLRAERAVTRGTDDGARKVNLIIRLR